MKNFWTRICGALAISAFLFAPLGSPALAQEKAVSPSIVSADKPTVLLAVNSIDKLVPDLMYVMRASGQQAYGGFITLFANSYGQGLDKTRPLGVSATINESSPPTIMLILPVSNIDTFFAANAQYLTFDELSENNYSITIGPTTAYGLLKDNWLYVSQLEDSLSNLPSNPLSLLEGLVGRYDIGVSLDAKAIPQSMKDQFLQSLKQGFETTLSRQSKTKTPEEIAAARESGNQSMNELKELVDGTQQLLVGLSVDQSEKVVHLDFGSKFESGIDIENQLALQSGLTTKFGRISQPAAPVQLQYRAKLGPKGIDSVTRGIDAQIEQLDTQLKSMMGEGDAKEIALKFSTAVFNAVKETVSTGDIDGAYGISFENGPNLVALGQVAAPEKLESEIVGMLKSHAGSPNAPKLNGGLQKYKGTSLYEGTWALPAEKDLDGLRSAVGDTLPFALVFGKNVSGFAFGKNATASLKTAVDQSAATPTPATPLNLTLELVPILQYADGLVDDPRLKNILQTTIATASENADKDLVRIESRAMNSGFVFRLVLEEGVLRTIGTAATVSSAPQRK